MMDEGNKCTKRKIDKSNLNKQVQGASLKNNSEEVKTCDQQVTSDIPRKNNDTSNINEIASSSKRHDFPSNNEKQHIIRTCNEMEILSEYVADNSKTSTEDKGEAKSSLSEYISNKNTFCEVTSVENLKDKKVGDIDDTKNNNGNIFTQGKKGSIRKLIQNEELPITDSDEAQDLSHISTQSDFKISPKENEINTSVKNKNTQMVATNSKSITKNTASIESEIDLASKVSDSEESGKQVERENKIGNIFTQDKQGSIMDLIKNKELSITESDKAKNLGHVSAHSDLNISLKKDEMTTSTKHKNTPKTQVATKSEHIMHKTSSEEPKIDLTTMVGGTETNYKENLTTETESAEGPLKATNSNSAVSTEDKLNEETKPIDNKNLKQSEVESIACAICLEPCSQIAFADPCRHQFCYMCILQWSEIRSVCPLCKRNFTSIHHNIRDDKTYDKHLVSNSNESASSVTNQRLNQYEGASRTYNTNAFIPTHLEIEEIFPLVRQQIQRQRQLAEQVSSRVCATGADSYICRLCGMVCGSGTGLAFHMRAHERQHYENSPRQTLSSPSSSHKCGLCGMICGSGAGLASHMRAHERQHYENSPRQTLSSPSSSHKGSYECGLCGMICGSGAGLASHMRAHERQHYENSPRQTLSSPSSSHKGSYECGLCGTICGSGAGLASHMRAHERRQQESYSYQQRPAPSYSSSCSAGSSSYGYKSASSHSYSCSYCGMECTSGAGLASHMRAHDRRRR